MSRKALLLLWFCWLFQLHGSISAAQPSISLNRDNITIQAALLEISEQINYSVGYEEGILEGNRKISLHLVNKSLPDALEEVLKGTGCSYSIKDRHILIERKNRQEVPPQEENLVTIRGTVVESLAPLVTLPGVSIQIKGTFSGTITDADGNFSIRTKPGSTLIFSYIGYKKQEITVSNKETIEVVMQTDESTLEEIVVVGYGTQKRANLTGATATISAQSIENRALADIGYGLQGLVPNLNITSGAGDMGSAPAYNIRGATSINTSGSPLFVVDGIPVSSLREINPADVESITVLKDAASAAIYGARAPFGVILVTTKSGKKDSKPVISYSGLFSWNAVTYRPNQVNSLKFAEVFNEAADNARAGHPFGDDVIEGITNYMNDPANSPYIAEDKLKPNNWFGHGSYANTNWFDEFYKQWSGNQTHNLSIQGGSKTVAFYLSAGLYDQDGMMRYADEKFTRYNVTSNLSVEILPWLNVGAKIRFNNRTFDVPFKYANYYATINTLWPNIPVKTPYGHFTEESQLGYLQDGGRDNDSYNDFWTTLLAEVKPLKGWKINFDYTYNGYWGRRTSAKTIVYTDHVDGTAKIIDQSTPTRIWESTYDDRYTTLNLYSSYEYFVKGHQFKIMAGFQNELKTLYAIHGDRENLISQEYPAINNATGMTNLANYKSHWSTVGYFGRFNYDYKEKYLLEINARYDGSSKFARGHRWGLFPSISAGYNIARENFWEPLLPYVNHLKFRASYGSLGNQTVANYQFVTLMEARPDLAYIINDERPFYIIPPRTSSPDITWETIKTFDIGTDIYLFNNKLDISFDWYRRENQDMLGPAEQLPGVYGISRDQVTKKNNADMLTKGFEVTVNWRDRIGKVGYNVGLNLADWKAKITRYNNPTNILSTYYVGQTFNEIWGYQTVGLFQNASDVYDVADQIYLHTEWYPGDVQYADLDGNGYIDDGEKTATNPGDMRVIGNSTPRYTFGITLGADWNNFDFSMLWQGVGKRDAWLSGSRFWGVVGDVWSSNVYEETLDYWSENNRNAYYPRPYLDNKIAPKNMQVQTRYLQNAAYARLKNIQIGYSIPPKILNRISIDKARIFITGENMFTITPMIKTMDPETIGSGSSGAFYPLQKTISMGVSITL